MMSQKNIIEHNPSWPQIPHYPYKILLFGDLVPGKTSALFNIIVHQSGIDKTFLCAKDPYQVKYQLLINKIEITH